MNKTERCAHFLLGRLRKGETVTLCSPTYADAARVIAIVREGLQQPTGAIQGLTVVVDDR